ncbi:hypothetical protein N9L92_04675 [Saprospiraceae bacterium]|nr:hypothetical protein [Saprospiraceae bacterium]
MRQFCYYTFLVSFSFLIIGCKSDNNSKQYNDLFDEYFIPSQIIISRTSTEPTTLLQCQEAYNQGNYGLAAGVFLGYEPILEPPSRLAYATSLIKTDKEEAAIIQLKKLEPVPLYNEASYWYQGLLSLRKSDIENMKTQFAQIKEGSRYKPKTLEVISKIK